MAESAAWAVRELLEGVGDEAREVGARAGEQAGRAAGERSGEGAAIRSTLRQGIETARRGEIFCYERG